jgi:Biotin-requiring enzyme
MMRYSCYVCVNCAGLHAEPQTIKVPQMAESITEGTLKQWQKKVGEHVEQDEEVATIETDKVGTRMQFRYWKEMTDRSQNT